MSQNDAMGGAAGGDAQDYSAFVFYEMELE